MSPNTFVDTKAEEILDEKRIVVLEVGGVQDQYVLFDVGPVEDYKIG